MLLVKFSSNWADEFDVNGFTLMEQAQYDLLVRYYSHSRASFNFGTNEGFDNYDHGDNIAKDFSAEEISDEDVAVLRKLFPELNTSYNPTYGIFPYVDEADEAGIADLDSIANEG